VVNRPGGLQADDVAKRAEQTSFDVQAKSAELRAAEAQVSEAKAAYIPQVKLTARYTRTSDTSSGTIASLVAAPSVGPGPIPDGTPLENIPLSFPTFLNTYAFEGSLSIPLSDYLLRMPYGKAAAEHGAESARENEKASRRKSQLDGRLLYYQWAQAKLSSVVAEQALEAAREHLADVKKAANVGAASNADVMAVEAQVAQAELLLVRTRNLAGVQETRLRTLIHDTGNQPYEIGEDLAKALPPSSGPAPSQDAGINRPEAKALSEAVKAQRQQIPLERAAALPRLDAVANAQYANPNQRIFPSTDEFNGSWDVTLQLTWIPTDIPASMARKRAASAKATSLEAQRQQLLDGIRIEIAQAQSSVAEADAAVETTARGVAAAEESYRVRRVLFQNGKATNVELTDAETEMTQARLQAIDARVSQRIARAQLEFAVGQ
jgi:outer membrane protein TolC